jgi:hypothetical protein
MTRINAILCFLTVAVLAATGAAEASTRQARVGNLAGTTKVETACPVPSPLCTTWKPFPHAEFTVVRLTGAGTVVAGTKRTVRSDARGHFRLSLRAGRYRVKPARGTSMKGGASRTVRVRRGATRTVVIRFIARFRRH